MNWIKVEEFNCHPCDDYVLIYGVLDDEDSPNVHYGYRDGKDWLSIEQHWEDHDYYGQKKILAVTHFMPLPGPPT